MMHGSAQQLQKKQRRRKVARIFTLALVGVLSFAGTASALSYHNINSSLTSKNVDNLLGEARPTKKPNPTPAPPKPVVLQDPFHGEAANILVIGSDIRDGSNSKYGDDEGMRSDTTMLAHISADRKSINVISIPRDSWVEIPACTRSDGTTTIPRETKFNTAFALGGAQNDVSDAAACTIKTVETLTGVFIDGYAVIDFTGFEDMVDAVGGIPFKNKEDLISPKANLDLPAGKHVLNGITALGVMRARTGDGLDGSDISRIERQQELLISFVEKALSGQTLRNPQALYSLGSTIAESLTVSDNLGSVTRLAGLAYSIRDIPVDQITFLTVPIAPHADGNNVVWTAEADQLWEYLQEGQSENVPSITSGYGSKPKSSTKKPQKVTNPTLQHSVDTSKGERPVGL